MPELISRETREQLEALCRKMSVSHKLDAEIGRELYAHMEDRLLAHMNGEIPLTEQDAFILVREHFGDPAVIKEHLQEVHADEAASSVGRRLVAAFAACTAAGFICTLLQLCTGALPAFLGDFRGPLQAGLFTVIELVFNPWVMYRILRAWRTRMERGEGVWFLTLSAGSLFAVFGITTVLMAATIPFGNWVKSAVPNPFNDGIGPFGTLGALASIVIMGMVWIWFCDQPPRTKRAVRLAVPAWALVLVLAMLTAAYQQDTPWNETLLNASMSLLFALIFSLFSLGLYRLAKRFHRDSDTPLSTE